MKVAIANFSAPVAASEGARAHWARHRQPVRRIRSSLSEQAVGWGFHIHAIGVYLLDAGVADEVEVWEFGDRRSAEYGPDGVLKLTFLDEDDLEAYLERFGDPHLFVNHGRHGVQVLQRLAGRCFRVHVPALRSGLDRAENDGADCYLVDAEEFLDERSRLYVPVVNTWRISPGGGGQQRRDFVYLASCYPGKRQDIVVEAVRGTALTGHFHPVGAQALDLAGTHITTSDWDQIDVVDLLRTSRIAVYPGDNTSNPAAMWECVAAGLPIVVNREIRGGKHLVVSGVTGELASPDEFLDVMQHVLANLDSYSPREYFEEHWDTVRTIEGQLAFFAEMGLRLPSCS